MVVKKRKIIEKMVVLAIGVFTLIINRTISTSYFAALVILGIGVCTLANVGKNWKSLIIVGFILWSNYSICIANLISPIDNFFTGWRNDDYLVQAINIMLVFIMFLYSGFSNVNKPNVDFYENNKHNSLIALSLGVVLFIILIFAYIKPEESGARGTSTVFYEYSIILFIMGFHYAGNRFEKVILSIILFIFVLQDLIYGGRITALQLLICWFLIFLSHRVSLLNMLPVFFIGVLIFSIVGSMRGNYIIDIRSIQLILAALTKGKFTLDTAYSAFYTSITFLKVKDSISIWEQLGLFLNFLLSMIFGGNTISNSNLSEYTHQFYRHYYGGILPYFGYFYLGYLGVIIFALYINFLYKRLVMNETTKRYKDLHKCLSIFFVCCVPKWYLYSPSSIIRGLILFIIGYSLCYCVDVLMSKKAVIKLK